MRRYASVVLGIVVLAGALTVLWVRTAPSTPPAMESPSANATYAGFTIETDTGPLALSDLHGTAVIVYFGYLGCPDICPTTMATLGAAIDALDGEQQDRVTAVMVSIDPERDTVDRLGDYARYFHPRFRAGTASLDHIATIAEDWGVVYRKTGDDGSAMGYSIDHSTDSFLIGSSGLFIERIAHGTSAEDMTSMLVKALEMDS